jgi:hypothetical protein
MLVNTILVLILLVLAAGGLWFVVGAVKGRR